MRRGCTRSSASTRAGRWAGGGTPRWRRSAARWKPNWRSCRAWTIPIGSNAVKAAGAIHTDFEKKFIRAEVVNWKALIDHEGYAGVKEKGLLRLEGKEYNVRDGDVLVIRH